MNEHQPLRKRRQDSPVETEMGELEAMLSELDLSERSRVRQPLRENLLRTARRNLKGAYSMNRTSVFRKPAPVLAVLAVLILTLFALPPVQVFARQVLAQIGGIIVTDMQINLNAPPTPEQPTAVPLGSAQKVSSAAEAAEKAGFPVLEAGYIPQDYRLYNQQVTPLKDGTSVSFAYYKTTEAGGGNYLVVSQTRFNDGAEKLHFPVGDAPVEELTLRGVPAVWIGGNTMGIESASGDHTELLEFNQLIWEEDGITLMVSGNDLSQEEAIVIANSLK